MAFIAIFNSQRVWFHHGFTHQDPIGIPSCFYSHQYPPCIQHLSLFFPLLNPPFPEDFPCYKPPEASWKWFPRLQDEFRFTGKVLGTGCSGAVLQAVDRSVGSGTAAATKAPCRGAMRWDATPWSIVNWGEITNYGLHDVTISYTNLVISWFIVQSYFWHQRYNFYCQKLDLTSENRDFMGHSLEYDAFDELQLIRNWIRLTQSLGMVPFSDSSIAMLGKSPSFDPAYPCVGLKFFDVPKQQSVKP